MTTLCYCDGGCSGNGTADARVYGSYKIGSEPIKRIQFDAHTNNEGEYHTLISLLTALRDSGVKDALIRCDSQLVVQQVGGRWRVKEPRLRGLCDMAQNFMRETGAALEWARRDEVEAVLGH